ncbi:MAG: iron-containing alcohol dehydrogenase [Devosia sp.]
MSDIITYLTKIRFGCGALGELGQEIGEQGIARPMIVTDPGLAAAGLVETVRNAGGLDAASAVFDRTPQNPTKAAVDEALAALKDAKADGLVAIGGGSSIDLAKAVALLATHDGPLETYAAIRGGVSRIGRNVLPVIAIPTTAGTGSEVGRAALITLDNERKLGIVSPNLIPTAAICDPELTRSLPPRLTAATGMDALSHCVETYLSPRVNPPADAIALDGLARAWSNLRLAVMDGNDMNARSEMMMAALQGALAFQKGLGAVHSISHALGGLKGHTLHHGTLNAVMLPPVLRFNEPACEQKYRKIRSLLGFEAGADLAGAFAGLNQAIGLPPNLSEMGLADDVVETAAKFSLEDHSTATNPRPASEGDFAAMIRDAM